MIDAAPPGGTVNVAPGIYHEQLVINKALTLAGPDPSMGEAIVDAAGAAAAPTLLITSSQVTVKLLTLQKGPGRGIQIGATGFFNLEDIIIERCTIREHDLSGIINVTSSAMEVVGCTIENNGSIPSFERIGIFLRPHGETAIIDNSIHQNGDGIYAEGSDSGLLIEGNTIENEFSSGITLAWDEQNVTIKNNSIRNCGLDGDELKGGIVIIQSLAEIITGNTIEDCRERGIVWVWVPSAGPEPAEILITNNRISGSSHDAIYLFSQGPGSFISPDPYALKPLISDNLLKENSGAGVFVANAFLGNPTGTANPHLENNSIEGNGWGVYNETATTVDAVNNWWGESSGPFHPLLNPDGTGNPVSDRVDFIPWKEQPPLPPFAETVCIRADKVYWRCKHYSASEEEVDLSGTAQGEIVEIHCAEVSLSRQHPVAVKKIKKTDQMRVSFFYRYTLRYLDRSGWKVYVSPPIPYVKDFNGPPLARDQRIRAAADIYLDCPECFVSSDHRVTCCISKTIIMQLLSSVALLIPAYGFCPEPEKCREGNCLPTLYGSKSLKQDPVKPARG